MDTSTCYRIETDSVLTLLNGCVSRRPCVGDNYVPSDTYEKKYNVAVTGLATRTDGVDILNSTEIDEIIPIGLFVASVL